jgi:glycerate kinase
MGEGRQADSMDPQVIVIAMDSFKGCIDSLDAADSVAEGILTVQPDAVIHRLPIADGGEGTMAAIAHGLGGIWISCSVSSPDGSPVEVRYLSTGGDTAILELAAASGLTLVRPEKRNPLSATTFGTGELLLDALNRGYRKIYIGVGGSATNDGGVGLMTALGARFLDAEGKGVPCGGGFLGRIEKIDLSGIHPGVSEMSMTVACDVSNPLCGETGASFVFGPQKGATPEMVALLDRNLQHYAEVVFRETGINTANLPGSGAAGGVNASLVPFCGAVLKPGIEWVLEAVGLEARAVHADLVITGEGRMDGQSIYGKAPIGVASIAKKHGVPVVAIVGDTGPGFEAVYGHGIDQVVRLRRDGMSVAESMAQARMLLSDAGAGVARELPFTRAPAGKPAE